MKIWLTRNVKRLAFAIFILAIVVAIPTNVRAEETQRIGLGPRLEINGHQFYVRVDWEGDHVCDIEGPIKIKVVVPNKSEYTFGGEGAGRFDCNGDGIFDTILMTQTEIVEGYRNRRVRVLARVDSPDTEFPTRIVLFRDSDLLRICNGLTNKRIKCRSKRL